MAKHDYFTRIEHINGYVNARPIFELFSDGLVEADSESIGPYGTITIAGGQGQDGLEDGKYWIFSMTDDFFLGLEQTSTGSKIRAKDFLARAKSVDAFSIREVIRIPSTYNIDNYNAWSKEVFSGISTPLTKNVFLYNNQKIYGQFKYQLSEGQGIIFTPNASSLDNTDANIVRGYDAELLRSSKTLIGIQEYQSGRYAFGEYSRYIVYLKNLPEQFEEIDCISDSALKKVVETLLASEGMTRSQRNELKASIEALPEDRISERRRQRILELAQNGELADLAIKLIPTVIASDEKTLSAILSKVFSNKDYINRLYPIIKEQEGFSRELAQLETERSEKLQELSAMENEKARQQVLLDESRRQIRETQRDLSKKIEEAYSNLAFDGTIASIMIEEAAKFEKKRKEESLKQNLINLSTIAINQEIANPGDLVNYLYEKLNNEAHRTITKNDVANILLCVSQDFITILAGEPGVGKTSLVNMVATLMGLNNSAAHRYTEISVEKGWTSRRDLIGYYNPLTKVFDSANRNLFEALSLLDQEKKNNIHMLPYWILLDEANLSQMEHYWADFMGVCDLNKKRRVINLGEDYQFELPDTLRFLATINLDHTTEALSARLIDRAWIIKLDSVDLDIDEYLDSELGTDYPTIGFAVLQQLYDAGRIQTEKMDEILAEKFTSIQDIFKEYGIRFSPRILGMIKKYCIASKLVMNLDNDEDSNSYAALDYAVAQKVLPMLNGYGDNYSRFIEKLIEECDETTMPKCNNLLRGILRNGKDNMQNYQFFGR